MPEREGVSFTQEQVELVFTEAAADFRSMGIESAALFRLNEPLSPAIMAHLYDCAYDFASLAFAIKNPTLLLFGENDERCALTVRIGFAMRRIPKTRTFAAKLLQ